MKNHSPKEQQEIYEYFLACNIPELLAALIAVRLDKSYTFNKGVSLNMDTPVSDWLIHGFAWDKTPEEADFWNYMHDCLRDFEVESITMEDYSQPETIFGASPEKSKELIEAMSTPDVDFESPTDEWIVDDKKSLAKIYTSIPVKVDGIIYKPLSFWTKVKLFFGRWGYKV